jgi:hypothetical protein
MSKYFKVGDKVSHPMWGIGVVIGIDVVLIYPVIVKFDAVQPKKFSSDGKYFMEDIAPSLYHGHGTFEIKFTPEPEPVFEWQWKVRRKTDGQLRYTSHYCSEGDMLNLGAWVPEVWEIVERDESTKREVKP